eukprot:COSAG01_NODE_11944_length_1829_cov_3.749133_1_plen_76_part_10
MCARALEEEVLDRRIVGGEGHAGDVGELRRHVECEQVIGWPCLALCAHCDPMVCARTHAHQLGGGGVVEPAPCVGR